MSVPFQFKSNSAKRQQYQASEVGSSHISESFKIKNLDHLGVIMGTVKRLGLLDLLDSIFPKHHNEIISTGESIVAMILNGLGFVNSPLSLTPHFFKNKAVESLFGAGVNASHFNHFKLGRALDDIYDYGCSKLFSEMSLSVCEKENISCEYNSLDTTSISVSGDYSSSEKEESITINRGYSKDKRRDLKQFVFELMVTQDGGIPLMLQSHNGNASDSVIFRERAQYLIDIFKQSDKLKILIGDCKLYDKETAASLSQLKFITRIPKSISEENATIEKALKLDDWGVYQNANEQLMQYKEIDVQHNDMSQRWIVCLSEESKSRAQESIKRAVKKEASKIEAQIKKLNAKTYRCENDLKSAIEDLFAKSAYHTLTSFETIEKKEYAEKGRPSKEATPVGFTYTADIIFAEDLNAINLSVRYQSCFVLGTNLTKDEKSTKDVITAYKNQQWVERGYGFLKGDTFFADSIFLKSPKRIEALMVVMTLALLIYSVAQRALRNHLAQHKKTLPNQLRKEVERPTMRWIFMMMQGIYEVKQKIDGKIMRVINGIEENHMRILDCMPEEIRLIYLQSTEHYPAVLV